MMMMMMLQQHQHQQRQIDEMRRDSDDDLSRLQFLHRYFIMLFLKKPQLIRSMKNINENINYISNICMFFL